jgi:serine/threonine protein kinase
MSTRASAGTVIEGKYRLERELGAGGMGAVWLATQIMVDRKVAVKLLHPAFMDQDDLQARFEVEARAIGRLNHPNCITLYDFGFSTDLKAFYTVIEYINGVSLDKRLSSSLPLTEVISIVKQISLALDHAHHQGILHRDLKPENVMLANMTDGSELVKVLDFGIARIVKGDNDTEEAQRITKAGEVFGTPAYMSPEQARSTRQLGPPADLYSLGVMFYELVAGNLPFFANSAFDLLMMHVTKPVPPIIRHDVPEEIKLIIYRLMDKDPANRFQSGRDLSRALDTVLGLPTMTEEIVVQGKKPTPTPTPTLFDSFEFAAHPRTSQPTTTSVSRPKVALFGVVSLLCIFAVMAGVFGYFSNPPDDQASDISEIGVAVEGVAVEGVAVEGVAVEDVANAVDPPAVPPTVEIVEEVLADSQTNQAAIVEPVEPDEGKPKVTTTRPATKSTKKTTETTSNATNDPSPKPKAPKKKFESMSPTTNDKKIENLSLER